MINGTQPHVVLGADEVILHDQPGLAAATPPPGARPFITPEEQPERVHLPGGSNARGPAGQPSPEEAALEQPLFAPARRDASPSAPRTASRRMRARC